MLSKIFQASAESQLADALSTLEKEFMDRLAEACEPSPSVVEILGKDQVEYGMAADIKENSIFAVQDRAQKICDICLAVMASIPGEVSADVLEFARSCFIKEYQKVKNTTGRTLMKIPGQQQYKEPPDLSAELNDGMALLARELGGATEKPLVEPPPVATQTKQSNEIFLVHGHDHGLLEKVARFLEHLGQNVHILDEKPNQGRTLIEKFEQYADRAGFAVVLLTPDDIGGQARLEPAKYQPRSRQNVIFELGYFIGFLGRRRVCAIYMPEVELPSDYQGIAYIPFNSDGNWRLSLARELKAAGLSIDLNLAF